MGAPPESAKALGREAGHDPGRRAVACFLLFWTPYLASGLARVEEAQTGPSQTQASTAGSQPPMLVDSIEAAESDEASLRKFTKWNHYEGPYATLKFGGSVMYDVATYWQDGASKEQVGDLEPTGKWRDFRFVLLGTFPKVEWLTWKAGVMFDGASQSWLVRETGLITALPGVWGHLFIGRTKEGFSMVKHMVGTSIWGLERSPFLDAAIPVMADGVRWMGYGPRKHVVWNLGLFNEKYSQSRHSPYYDRQAVLRIAWLPYAVEDSGTLLHLGLNLRYADPQDGELQFKARPEATTAPFFVDTGSFPARHTTIAGPEVYYRDGPLIVGTEYHFEKVDSPETQKPLFQGGDITAIWAITGETRSYSTRGGLFGYLIPKNSVFKGGLGAWEVMLRFSYTNADSGSLEGGKLWRVSPILAWYLSDQVRWTIGYGYADLDRFGLTGKTQFLQSRIHVQF